MRNFVVTGSTKGIGFSIVAAILEKYRDAKVYMSYVHDDNAAEHCRDLYGGRVVVTKVDLSSYQEMENYCSFLREQCSSIYALILNAGIGYKAHLLELDIEQWEKVMRVNVSIPIFMIKNLITLLKNSGSIVMAGSVMGNIPHSGSLVYGVSKGAVHAAVKNLVKFLSDYNVRINAIAPGFTLSEWHKEKPKSFFDRISMKIGVHRWATSREIAEAYLFAIENKYINGSVISIDGGYSYF
jgi:3-oxoacyl-[acyl-carrier protein] reductase